jgi:DNA primase
MENNEPITILEKLINEDFGIDFTGTRWGKSKLHSSLVIDREKQIFYWNSEGIVGDALIYLTRVRGWTFQQAKDYLKVFPNYENTYIVTEKKDKPDIIIYPKMVDLFWENGKNHRDYWYRRGITDETIDRFKLGYYKGFNTIPFYVDGILRNFQLRMDNPKTIRNLFKNVGPIPFNTEIMKYTDTIVLTEAPTSAIVLNQNGIPAVSHNGGSECFLNEWIKYYVHQRLIYIVYDNDKAGRIGAKKVANILGIFRCRIYTFSDLDENDYKGYDAGDYFKDGGRASEFMSMLKEKSKLPFQQEY